MIEDILKIKKVEEGYRILLEKYVNKLKVINRNFERVRTDLRETPTPRITNRIGSIVNSIFDNSKGKDETTTSDYLKYISETFPKRDITYDRDIFEDLKDLDSETEEVFGLKEILNSHSLEYEIYKIEKEIKGYIESKFDFKGSEEEKFLLIPAIEEKDGHIVISPSKEVYTKYFSNLAQEHLRIISSNVYDELIIKINDKVSTFKEKFLVNDLSKYYTSLKKLQDRIDTEEAKELLKDLMDYSAERICEDLKKTLNDTRGIDYLDKIEGFLENIKDIDEDFWKEARMNEKIFEIIKNANINIGYDLKLSSDSGLYIYLRKFDKILKSNNKFLSLYIDVTKLLDGLLSNFLDNFISKDENPESPYITLLNKLDENYKLMESYLPKTAKKLTKVLKSFEFLEDGKYHKFLEIIGYVRRQHIHNLSIDYHLSVGSLMNLLGKIKKNIGTYIEGESGDIVKDSYKYLEIASRIIGEAIHKSGVPIIFEDSMAQVTWYQIKRGNNNIDISNIKNESDKNFLYGFLANECHGCNEDAMFGYYFKKLYNDNIKREEIIPIFDMFYEKRNRIVNPKELIYKLLDVAVEENEFIEVWRHSHENEKFTDIIDLYGRQMIKQGTIFNYLDNSSTIKELLSNK